MKILTFQNANGQKSVAQLTSTGMIQPLAYPDGNPINNLQSLIESNTDLRQIRTYGLELPLDSVTVLAPLPKPKRNIFCVGKNYINHAYEFSQSGFDTEQIVNESIPIAPIVFTKTPETVIAHKDKIWDASGVSNSLDYEAELAVIIGTGGRGISKDNALKHVWGYTIINDVTARDWQKRHKQWHLGKSFDTFGPMGPVLVTSDELDAKNLDIKCWVNGELRQNANTRDLIFDIPTLIETISSGITLLPGDIIATGTPEGVGIGFNPPRFLKQGDVVTIEIEGIGKLENEIGVLPVS